VIRYVIERKPPFRDVLPDDRLEQTQDFLNPLGPGVWRRSTDPDTINEDYEDGMRSYSRAPELSLRYPSIPIRLMERQAE